MSNRRATAQPNARVVVNLGDQFGKPVPQAPEAEMALLGAIMLSHAVLSDVRDIVPSPSMFYSDAHAAIYEALIALEDSNRGGDLVQLVDRLQSGDRLGDVGGVNYLEKLARETPGPTGAVYWAKIVREKWTMRRTLEVCGTAIHSVYTSATNPTEVIDSLESGVFELSSAGPNLNSCASLSDLLDAEYRRLESRDGGVTGIPTGFRDLDKLIGGLKPGELTIIAARPSQGKTSLATDIIRHVANTGTPVGFFSLEMTRESVTQRILAARDGVNLQRLISNQLTDRERETVLASASLPAPPIDVDDSGSLSVSQARSRGRRWVRKGVGLIVLDYLQLMHDPGRNENRQVEVASISRGIKSLAKELSVPIVALCQLNRGAENRQDNRPRVGDLRESGAIEQDADCIMLLHREEQYHVGEDRWRYDNQDKIGVAEVIVAKQRNGPTGSVTLKWRAESTSFVNYSRDSEPVSATVGYATPIGMDDFNP